MQETVSRMDCDVRSQVYGVVTIGGRIGSAGKPEDGCSDESNGPLVASIPTQDVAPSVATGHPFLKAASRSTVINPPFQRWLGSSPGLDQPSTKGGNRGMDAALQVSVQRALVDELVQKTFRIHPSR